MLRPVRSRVTAQLWYEAGMSIAPELKEILACPRCKGELVFHDAENEIVCPVCKLVFRVEDDIPVMLIDEAKPLAG
jgi:uncharacterized protein YbaR (Trm112 family)